jgi:glycosyltransferase involved in cell wall biosynthesis
VKIGLIVPGGFYPGGRERIVPSLVGLAGELASRHEVHVFAAGSGTSITDYWLRGAQVHDCGVPPLGGRARLAKRIVRSGRLAYRLRGGVERASASGPFDVLHAFWIHDTAAIAVLIGRARRVPVVVSLGGGEPVWLADLGYGGARSPWARARTAAILRMADAVTAGSDFGRDLLGRRSAPRARVIPLGAASTEFSAPDKRADGPPWHLVHVACLNPVKDQQTLLRAFVIVRERLGDVRLDCVGEDTLDGRIQRLARDFGIADHVHFWGFLPQDELAPLYRAAHLNVLASRHESQSVVVLEAGAAGLPTVGTAVGLLPSLAPVAASCVPPNNPQALAEAICALLGDPARRLAMGEAARHYSLTHDLAWTARAFEELYELLRYSPS